MPGTVNSAYTGDSISLGVLCIGLADRVESGTTRIDLIDKDLV